MKDPNDARDTRPRVGSPPWIHLAAVTVPGLAVLGLAMTRLSGIGGLVGHPLIWAALALMIAGQIWPVVAAGRTVPQAPPASVAFSFAILLYWGLPTALLLSAVAIASVGAAQRRSLRRSALDAAQLALSMTAAWLAIAAAGKLASLRPLRSVSAFAPVRAMSLPSPGHPWTPGGWGLLLVVIPAAAAFFAVSYPLAAVGAAVASRSPVLAALRAQLRRQGFACLVLLAVAPLVTVVMAGQSALLLLLFAVPLSAACVSAALSAEREHQAYHDELTGLCNRNLLIRHTGEALAAATPGSKVGFLLLDLDRFKEVNDTLGHPVGDRLLGVMAQRLMRSVRPGDVVARLGGDEFAVLLPSVRLPSAAREVAARLRAALSEPIWLDGMSFEIAASVGIALYPDDAAGFEVLMQRADVAMYHAKERRSGVERYLPDYDRNSPARLELLGDLRRGLNRGELELHFQPKVALAGSQTAGMEALVRWHHPVRGLMAPGEFIPFLDQSYLTRDLTIGILDMALEQASRWWRDGMPVQISMNLAARDLMDISLADTIGRRLEQHRLPPEALLLEINERALTTDPARAVTTAETLAALGIGLSLDDFGTGYSSLVRLQRLPITEVKIDSSFIGRVLESGDDAVIVKSIVDLVRALGIRSVAEGVESGEVAAALRKMGCVAAQGWYFSKPLNAAAATSWLAEHGCLLSGRPAGPALQIPAPGGPPQTQPVR